MPEAISKTITEPVIAAIATALGGAIAVIRVSGADAVAVAQRLWQGKPALARLPPRVLTLGRVGDAAGQPMGPGPGGLFPPPVPVIPANPWWSFRLMGAPPAPAPSWPPCMPPAPGPPTPGEFTRRAFLNGRLDLTQAEAVADLIAANSRLALRQAELSLEGGFGAGVRALWQAVTGLAAEVEARLDFPEETARRDPGG